MAQNPGGVGAGNLKLWLKGNYSSGKLTFAVSPNVQTWVDENGSGYTLSRGSSTQMPKWVDGSSTGPSSDSLNYNPHLQFDSSSRQYVFNNASTDLLGTAGTIFIVCNKDLGSKTTVSFSTTAASLYRYQVKTNFRVQTSNGISVGSQNGSSVAGYTASYISTSYISPTNNARITVSRGFAASLISRWNATQNGLNNSNVAGFCPGVLNGTYIGGNPANLSSAEYIGGRIAEVILYNTSLSDANVQSIETYLGVKYGITLNPAGLDATNGYVNSAGTSIYKAGSDGTTYWNNIIGVGRDSTSGLFQKQSHQYDDSVRIYMGTLATTNAGNTTPTITDKRFIMTGSTSSSTKLNDDAATAAEKPAAVSIRMDREWKVINTAFTNSYTMTFRLNSSANVWWSTHVLTLLVDDDGNFTNATNVSTGTNGITIIYNAGVITVTINPSAVGAVLPVNSTKYITPAATSAILPYELLSFDAVKINNNTVKLNWKTVGETDTDHFAVEKSSDKNNWQLIRSVQPEVNAAGAGDYQITDNEFNNDVVYYHIKQFGKSGKVNYSEMRMVKLYSGINNVSVFPNPAKDRVKISWSGYGRPVSINVYTASGTRVKTPYVLNDGYAEINISNLPAGLYVIAAANTNTILYGRLLKQ